MKGTKEDVKRQKYSQKSDEGSVPSSQDSHPSSSPPKAPEDNPKCPLCGLPAFIYDTDFDCCLECKVWLSV